MPRYSPCDPPCSNSRCYGCNATARDLAVKAKRAGQTMSDLPVWTHARIRRMAEQTAQAQQVSEDLNAARETRGAYRSYSDRMKASDVSWVCAGCEAEQDVSIEKFVWNQRRYCPTCAAPIKARHVIESEQRIRETQALQEQARLATERMRAAQEATNARLAAENQAARSLESSAPLERCGFWLSVSHGSWWRNEVSGAPQCVMREGHAGEHRVRRPSSVTSQTASNGEQVQNARDARRGHETRAANALENAGASAELATRQLAQAGNNETAKHQEPLADRFDLIELDETPPDTRPREIEPLNRPIDLD